MLKNASEFKNLDADTQNWVDNRAPAVLRPYFRLMRLDRPIGTWLLLWPCWWSLFLGLHSNSLSLSEILLYLFLLGIGSLLMRSAGCVWNDLLDEDLDGKVQRTRNRPLPSGQLSQRQAIYLLATLLTLGFIVLLQFNWVTIIATSASLVLVAIYPLAKRFTNWPQAVLGLCFNWGTLTGYLAVTESFSWSALLLYIGCFFWTMAYDTIYALQDKEDDALIGVRSTALLFGDGAKKWIGFFYALAFLNWWMVGAFYDLHFVYFVAVFLASLHVVFNFYRLVSWGEGYALKAFRSSHPTASIIAMGMIASYIFHRLSGL